MKERCNFQIDIIFFGYKFDKITQKSDPANNNLRDSSCFRMYLTTRIDLFEIIVVSRYRKNNVSQQTKSRL